jgi:hypothetical protein
LLNREFIALRNRFYAAIFAIAHPTVDFERTGYYAHRFTKTNALHSAGER